MGSQTACRKCPKGTWSEQRGAGSDSTCVACAPGKYQPADGQANHTSCLSCSPGSYSTVPGTSACSLCPAGTWSGEFDATTCNVCPEGKWTFYAGARRQGDCTPCAGTGCMRDASARITVEITNLAMSVLSVEEQTELSAAYARDIASTCGVNDLSVVDTHGKNTSVGIGEDGIVEAFVLSIGDGFSANTLAARLYSSDFRGLLEDTTGHVLGSGAGQISVGAVTFKPEAFVPPMPTTTTKFVAPTATSTATSTVSSTVTSTTTLSRLQTGFELSRTTPVSEVDVATEAVSTSMSTGTGAGMMQTTGDPSGPAWWLFVVSGVAVGAAAAVVMLIFQRARKGADELPLHV